MLAINDMNSIIPGNVLALLLVHAAVWPARCSSASSTAAMRRSAWPAPRPQANEDNIKELSEHVRGAKITSVTLWRSLPAILYSYVLLRLHAQPFKLYSMYALM